MNVLSRSIVASGLLATIATLVAAGPVRNQAKVEAMVTLTPTAAGCDITVRAHNNGSANVTIDLEDSEVKVRYGSWSKLNQGGTWVVNTGGEHESKVVSLDLGCNFNRQYKFLMRSGGDDKYIHFPSADGFTESQSLGLADIGRHF
jgi:hypothetical protein